jgi:hypothetical protein
MITGSEVAGTPLMKNALFRHWRFQGLNNRYRGISTPIWRHLNLPSLNVEMLWSSVWTTRRSNDKSHWFPKRHNDILYKDNIQRLPRRTNLWFHLLLAPVRPRFCKRVSRVLWRQLKLVDIPAAVRFFFGAPFPRALRLCTHCQWLCPL